MGAAAVSSSAEQGWLARVLDFLEQRRRYSRTLVELESLSDRELADIGLNRGDIEGIARRCLDSRR